MDSWEESHGSVVKLTGRSDPLCFSFTVSPCSLTLSVRLYLLSKPCVWVCASLLWGLGGTQGPQGSTGESECDGCDGETGPRSREVCMSVRVSMEAHRCRSRKHDVNIQTDWYRRQGWYRVRVRGYPWAVTQLTLTLTLRRNFISDKLRQPPTSSPRVVCSL